MKFAPLSRSAHSQKRLRQHASLDFARSWSLMALCGAELSKAALEFPIAFAVNGGVVFPVAVMFPEPGNNAFISTEGRWLAEYLPATVRAYPFNMGSAEGQDEQILAIDEDAANISDTEGELLFTEDGEPSPILSTVRDFFVEIERDRKRVAVACAALVKHALLVRWNLKVETTPGEMTDSKHVLFQVNEAALCALLPEAVAELWNVGAFPLIYSHLLSLGRLPHLMRLSLPLIQSQTPEPEPAPLPPNNALDLDRVFGIVSEDHGFQFTF